MKALRLEITAFGAFAEKEVIDFSEVEGVPLLLIHGPTGSGKTTILDAMCFALFGDTSGAEREAKAMRSHFAPDDLPTVVRYEFALGSKRYCVERLPEQERPAKRGGGTTTDSHTATLWDQSKVGKTGGEGKVLATGAAKVKTAIVEIFGFDSEQFRQVVMLPQGQFRKLLTAESKEKEKILQRLFQTTHYARLERALAERASHLRVVVEKDVNAMQTLLGHEETESIEELGLRIEKAVAEHGQAKSAVPASKKASEQASATKQRGEKDNALLDEKESAHKAIEVLRAKDAELATLRSDIAAATRAVPLMLRAEATATRQKEAKEAGDALAASEVDFEKYSEAKQIAALALQEQEKRQPELQEMTKERALLDNMQGSVKSLSEGRAKLEKQEKHQAEAQATLKKAVESLGKSERELESTKKSLAADEKLAAQAEALKLTLSSSEASFSKREALDGMVVRGEKEAAAHKVAAERLVEVQGEVVAKEAGLADLEGRWRRGQAGSLARELKEGDACPVCGSEEHPTLAAAPESLPSEDAIEEGKVALREARALQEKCQELESSCRGQVSVGQSRQEDLAEELGEAAKRDLEEWRLEITAHKKNFDGAEGALERAKVAGRKLAAEEQVLKTAAGAEQGLKTSLEQLRVDTATITGSVKELESKVPPHLRPPGSLDAATADLSKKMAALSRALEKAQTKVASANQDYAASEAKRSESKKSAKKAQDKASSAADEFAAECRKGGFPDSESFAAAKAGVEELSEWEVELKQHEGNLRAAGDRLERAEKAAQEVVRADLEALGALADAAKAAHVAAVVKETDAKGLLERLRKVQSEYEKIQKRVATQEEQWRIVASVSDLANGKVPPKVSFQRFVLAALLDEVLLAANERLGRMSKGRYGLQRTSGTRHKAKASGLELEVLDAYTGSPRPVSTLSGGESFLAAMALSLGLADVVQGFSGGIRLDTLFIDEGFGTLDSDALDLAIDTLTELNAEGRLVGIISHVDELKSRIPTRLELIPAEQGSSTRFVGGLFAGLSDRD